MEVVLSRLGREVAVARGRRRVVFPPQAEGGYAVSAAGAATALDVLADPFARPRYGFASEFPAGRDPAPIAELARRLHLNAVQLYDWMYRHASLLPPRDRFRDALGRELSLASVRRLVSALREVGAAPLGYAAVYAAGPEEWPVWQEAGLYRRDGEPWGLGEDFLRLVDPADTRWGAHFAADLRRARDAVGFAGFHLDQYGWPKRALRADGTEVDLAESFLALLRRLRRSLGRDTRLIFNNVNDFPTWATAPAPQDAVYVEVWPPHDGLEHLAGLVTRARAFSGGRPPILAAYLSVFAQAPEREALAAAELAMATIFSHGGAHLLLGEEGAVLTDPYYPKHHRLGTRALERFRRWYDFVVALGDVLYDPAQVDVTRTVLGGVNEEILLDAPVPVTTDPRPGSLWARVVETAHGRVLHLVNLTAQRELAWDAPKRQTAPIRGARLSVARTRPGATLLRLASPDRGPAPRAARTRAAGAYDVAALPPLGAWTLVLLD